MRLEDIGKLTRRQVDELYFHARDEQHQLVPPQKQQARPKTPKDETMAALVQLESARALRLISQESYEEAKAKLLERKRNQEAHGRAEAGKPD